MVNAVIGALRANLALDTAQFAAGFRNAQGMLGRFEKQFQPLSRSMSRFGGRMRDAGAQMGIAFLPGAAALRQVVNVGSEFEASLNRSQALLKASEEVMSGFSSEAMRLGRETRFSAVEAAGGIEMLARNGVSASDIMGGALASSLDLAAAGGTDLAAAADIATDAMNAFGVASEDMRRVADGAAQVVASSKFAMDDYRLAIAAGGGVVGSFGSSLEEFNTALAGTAHLFSSGRDAGTSFKTFMQRLTPDSKDAIAAMETLGVNAFDAGGNMLSLANIAGQLQAGMAKLTEKDRNFALRKAFGTDAVRTAIGLAELGTEGFQKLRGEMDVFASSDLAEARMKGTSGAMFRLNAAVEGLALAVANSGLLDGFTKLVEGLTDVINQISAADPTILAFGGAFLGLSAVVAPLIGGIGLLVAAIGTIGAPIAAVIAAVVAATAAFVAFYDDIVAAGQGFVADVQRFIWDPFQADMAAASEWISGAWDTVKGTFTGAKDRIVETMGDLYDGVKTWLIDRMGVLFDALGEKIREVGDFFFDLWERVVGNSYVPDMVDGIAREFARLPDVMTGPAEAEAQATASAFEGLGRAGDRVFEDLVNGTFNWRDALTTALREINQLVGGQTGSGGIISSLFGLGSALFGDVRLSNSGNAFGASGSLFNSAGQIALPGFAAGGFAAGGTLAIVGERGPEPVYFGSDARVLSNADFKDAVSGAASGAAPSTGGITVNVYGVSDADSFRRNEGQVAASIARAQRLAGQKYD